MVIRTETICIDQRGQKMDINKLTSFVHFLYLYFSGEFCKFIRFLHNKFEIYVYSNIYLLLKSCDSVAKYRLMFDLNLVAKLSENFVAMVWKSAKKVGCVVCTSTTKKRAAVTGINDMKRVVICQYDAGVTNVATPDPNELKQNVLSKATAGGTDDASAVGESAKEDPLDNLTSIILIVVSILLAISALMLCIFGIYVGFIF